MFAAPVVAVLKNQAFPGRLLAGVTRPLMLYDGEHERRLLMDRHGKVARVVVNVLGWAGFLVRAAASFAARKVGDTDSAFDVLGLGGGSVGNALFSAVALGPIAYGIVMYMNAVNLDFGEE